MFNEVFTVTYSHVTKLPFLFPLCCHRSIYKGRIHGGISEHSMHSSPHHHTLLSLHLPITTLPLCHCPSPSSLKAVLEEEQEENDRYMVAGERETGGGRREVMRK